MTKTDELRVDGWLVTDLPVPYTEKDYEQARAELIAQAKNTPELGALFEYGYIPFPGISDMDFFVVFPDDVKKMYLAAEPRLSEKTKHVMMHQTALITKKSYRKMLLLDPWTTNIWPKGHRLLFQNEKIKRDMNFDVTPFASRDFDAISLAYIEECMVSVYPVVPLYARKELQVRYILEDIKNCVYIIREIKKLTGQDLNPTFTDEFQLLRSTWFTLDQQDAARRLIKLFHEALIIIFESAFVMSEYISTRAETISTNTLKVKKVGLLAGSRLDKKYKNVYVNTFKGSRVYTSFLKDAHHALALSVDSCKEVNISLGVRSKTVDFGTIFLPYGLSAILLGSTLPRGFFGRTLQKDIYTNQDKVLVFNPPIFLEKAKLIDDITEIYDKRKVPAMNGKGFIYGSNHFGYWFSGEKIRRKLLVAFLKRVYWNTLRTLCNTNENKRHN